MAAGAARMAVLDPGRGGPHREAQHARHPQGVKIAVAAGDGGKGHQYGSTEDLHFDHVIPWSNGGANTLCAPCNRRKGADDIRARF